MAASSLRFGAFLPAYVWPGEYWSSLSAIPS